MLKDYQQGITPNPDILCNKYIKFDAFMKHALEQLEGHLIATGHYARSTMKFSGHMTKPTESKYQAGMFLTATFIADIASTVTCNMSLHFYI